MFVVVFLASLSTRFTRPPHTGSGLWVIALRMRQFVDTPFVCGINIEEQGGFPLSF